MNRESAKTVEQRRAAFALQEFGGNAAASEELENAATALPAMVLMNGLGQTLAFCKSRKGSWTTLYEALGKWLCAPGPQAVYENGDLLRKITEGDQARYRAAQAEALAVLQWIKNIVRARG